MEKRSIQEGSHVPQSERLFESRTDPQIANNAGGYVYKLDDIKRLLRFLIIGSDRTYYAGHKELENENKNCIKRLIRANKGVEVVNTIKQISISRRNVRQDALLFAYAVCARSADSNTKQAAYAVLSEICRIPTHLFMFIKYCEEVSKDEQRESQESGTTGWGRAHKRAIQSWYTNFERNPERLVRLIMKYRKRESWSHIDVIRLCHARTDDKVMKFIFSYIIKGYRKAIDDYNQLKSEASDVEKEKLNKITQLVEVFDEASRCEEVPRLCSMIKEYRLAWEHCNQNHITRREVWLSLLPHMPIEAMIRNLSRMTKYGLFVENSEDEQMVLDKIRSINVPHDHSNQEPHESLEDVGEGVEDELPWAARKRCKNFIHPMKLFFAWHAYKQGRSEIRESRWTPNQNITCELEAAFYRAYSVIEKTNKIFYLAVSTSLSTNRSIYNSSSVTQSLAAAAMLMLIARTVENCIIKSFGERVEDLDISSTDRLETIEEKIIHARHLQGSDCAEPIKDAIDMRRNDIDVFVYFTDSETSGGNIHPYEALLRYREYSNKPEVRMIVCGMNATDLTIADKEDPLMLNIVGCDAFAPWIISEFTGGQM